MYIPITEVTGGKKELIPRIDLASSLKRFCNFSFRPSAPDNFRLGIGPIYKNNYSWNISSKLINRIQ